MKLHLPKALFTAVMALFAISQTTWGESSEIWVNFGCVDVDSDTVPEDTSLPSGNAWNNVTAQKNNSPNGTYTLKNTARENVTNMTVTSSSGVAVWGPSDSGTNVLEQLQASYIDLSNQNADQTWGITLTLGEIEVDNITLTLFMSGDGSNSSDKYAPVYVNGVSYIGGTNTQGSGAWGDRSNTASASHSTDTNTIIVTGVSNNMDISSMARNQSVGGGRATIAGLSIVYEHSDVYTATLASNANDAAALSYNFNDATHEWSSIDLAKSYIALDGAADNTSEYAIAAGTSLKGIQSNSNTITVTSDGAIAVDKLWAVAGSTLNANFQQTEGTSTVLGGLGAIIIQEDLSASKTTVGTLQVAEGATLTLTGAGSSITSVSGSGKINLTSNATIDIQSESGLTGTEPDTNLKRLLSLATGSGTINVSGGSEAFIAGSTGAANLWASDFAGTISMAKGTKIVLGNLSTAGYSWNNWAADLQYLTIETRGGGIRFNGERSTIGTLNVKETDTLTLQDGAESIVGLTIKKLKLDADLTISNVWKGTSKIECLTGDGNMIINPNNANAENRKLIIEIADIEDYSGSIQYNPNANVGLLKIGTANKEIDLASAIQSGGDVQFAEGLTINITSLKNFDMTYNDEVTLWDVSANEDSTATGNGFITKSGSLYIVNGGTNNLADVTVKYNNNVVKQNDDGTYSVTSSEFGGDYILGGSGAFSSAKLSDIKNWASQGNVELNSVTLKTGNTLTVDTDSSAKFIIDAQANNYATLDISNTQTVSSVGVDIVSGNMKFTGDGTYTMLGGLKGEAAEDWHGHVYLEAKQNGTSGEKGEALKSVSNLDLTKYGNANSKITLRGVDGSLASNTAAIESDINFLNSDGGGWAALCITSGEASSHTFAGNLSGNGNIRVDVNHATDSNPTSGMSFTFSGDVSKFTGQLYNVQGYNTYEFQGDATAVNANILAGGTMNIRTNNTKDTTIKTISVSSKLNLENEGSGKMTVNSLGAGSGTTVNVTATAGDIEITGNATDGVKDGTTLAGISVANGKKVTVTDNVTVTTGLTFAGADALAVTGTLKLNDGISLDLTQFQVTQGVTTYTLAYASEGITADIDTFNISGLADYKYDIVLSATDPASAVAPANDAATQNYLVLQLALPASELTELTVIGGSYADGHLTLKTEQDATGAIFGDKLNAVMSDKVWDAIRADVDGEMKELITVSFVGADGTTLFDFNGEDGATDFTIPTITINGEGTQGSQVLSGDGTVVGNYVTAYIPEPTSTTLSLLALAALAVRRRRK